MNTPEHASDTAINRLVELEHETTYLRSVPADDWQLDINEDGAMIGRCPRCASRDISAVTPERLGCNDCGHRDGDQTVRVGASGESPGELLPILERDPDDCDDLFEEDDRA